MGMKGAPGLLDDADRARFAVCADLLATWPAWAGLCALSGLALLMLASGQHSLWLAPLWALWPCCAYLVVRVALDARLCHRLSLGAGGPLGGLPLLDQALALIGRVPQQAAPRPVAERLRGALRWYRALAALALLTLGWAALAWGLA